jgi:hypothetical protein
LFIVATALESEIVSVSWKHWAVDLFSSSSYLSLSGGLLAQFFEGIQDSRGLTLRCPSLPGTWCRCRQWEGQMPKKTVCPACGALPKQKWAAVVKTLWEGIMC